MHILSEDVVGARVDKCFMCGFTGVLLAVNLDRSSGCRVASKVPGGVGPSGPCLELRP